MRISLIEETEQFVFNLLKNELPSTFIYHNYTHTKRVLKSTRELIEHSDLTEKEAEILELAAMLHDVGYTKGCEKHEEESVRIAKSFLKEKQVDDDTILAVTNCIMATRFNVEPTTKLEKIIRDADASHFGKSYFSDTSELLRKELELQGRKDFSPSEWRQENIEVLATNHQFYTDYAIKNWQSTKDKNLAKLLGKSKKRKKKFNVEKQKAKYKAQYKVQYKDASPDRGIQTFYRVALRNHIKLSDIADTKANILLSVNAIIISLVLSNLISKLDNPTNDYLIIPTIIFTISSVICMVLSVLATRPNVTRGEFTKEDVKQKRVNLTFFGNFHKMELEEYQWAINELLSDKDYIYSSLTKDLYFLGKVLDRKYRILRLTYTIFMTGMIISVFAFAISFKSQPNVEIDDVLPGNTSSSSLIYNTQLNLEDTFKIL